LEIKYDDDMTMMTIKMISMLFYSIHNVKSLSSSSL